MLIERLKLKQAEQMLNLAKQQLKVQIDKILQ